MDKETYSQAVSKLVKLAQGDTGGSRVAAQVLLSAYNGETWQLNIVDLCVLDKTNYQARARRDSRKGGTVQRTTHLDRKRR